jgi:hypothetical protein
MKNNSLYKLSNNLIIKIEATLLVAITLITFNIYHFVAIIKYIVHNYD